MHTIGVGTAAASRRIAGVSERGGFRPHNEDRFCVLEDIGLAIVADGMGGHQAGEVAARIAVEAVRECVTLGVDASDAWVFGRDPALSDVGNLLRAAVQLANVRVLEAAGASSGCAGMGTTLVAALVRGRTLTIAHVGDSRAYLYAGGAGGSGLEALTRDDSWMAAMMDEPGIDAGRLRCHPLRHVLTSVVGVGLSLEVHVTERTLDDSDQVLITTDGVHGVLEPGDAAGMFAAGREPGDIARAIVQLALDRGSRDNCTAVVIAARAGA